MGGGKLTPVPLPQPQIPNDLTWDQIQATTLGSWWHLPEAWHGSNSKISLVVLYYVLFKVILVSEGMLS